MTEGMTCYERDETLCEDQMCLRTGCRLLNAALEPIQSMDIWQAYAAAQDELREANASLKIYHDTNHVLREELKFISAKTIEACARVAEKWFGNTIGRVSLGQSPQDAIAAEIRSLSQAPVIDAGARRQQIAETIAKNLGLEWAAMTEFHFKPDEFCQDDFYRCADAILGGQHD
jgi:hypothetical protein